MTTGQGPKRSLEAALFRISLISREELNIMAQIDKGCIPMPLQSASGLTQTVH